ncbi:MAG: hypothetical protein U9N85_13245 [Bacteroidota bacterium]|nr:hypothetical protein [Bacteroidota bacterium]
MNEYRCPECGGFLSLDNKVVFSIETAEKQKGILFLSSKLGDYSVVKHSSVEINDGDKLKISCPLCGHDLCAVPDKNLANVEMVDDSGETLTVLFSVKRGERATYALKGKQVMRFGEDADSGIDFENLSFYM